MEDPYWNNLSLLQNEIKKRIKARQATPDHPEHVWSKAKRIIEQIFTATSPFLKNFLTVAKEGSQVPLPNEVGKY